MLQVELLDVSAPLCKRVITDCMLHEAGLFFSTLSGDSEGLGKEREQQVMSIQNGHPIVVPLVGECYMP